MKLPVFARKIPLIKGENASKKAFLVGNPPPGG
jgi:hypothetical protein